MTKPLTEKQKLILDFINDEIDKKGYPPSVREICKAVGLSSTSTVHGYLQRLEKNGYLRKAPTKPRALQVLDDKSKRRRKENDTLPQKELAEVPVVGKVTAGQPILAVENIEDTFPLPVEMTKNSEVFALHVSGDSMIEAGILDGDLVIVRQQTTCNNGDIVVALLEEEATVKRFYKEDGFFRLQPENQMMEPIIVKDVTVLGKVIGVFRALK